MPICHSPNAPDKGSQEKSDLVLSLAGNANVGKSAIFNQLTGLEQRIGNWPGKTVEKAEGLLYHHDMTITILDLPGIYSLSTYSMEELISREFIALEQPDVVVNVVDATALERNLFFTLQLLEMEVPIVIALNMVDAARQKGIEIDPRELQEVLDVPVVPTIAIRGTGVHEVVDAAIAVVEEHRIPRRISYGPEVEKRIEQLARALEGVEIEYPRRWTAIKLLEEDAEVLRLVKEKAPHLLDAAKILVEEISRVHKEPCPVVISSERYAVAARIAEKVQRITEPAKGSWNERLDALTMHPWWGYPLFFALMLTVLAFTSFFGAWIAEVIEGGFESLNPQLSGFWSELAWSGGVVGFYAALTVALGFILPFYIILGFLEDSGYLPRIAYLMDRPCHTMGLHGKACIPLILGFGCNVPACTGCRIMETKRDRLIAIFLSTMVPCSARTAVILGLVGAFVGLHWAIFLYVLDFALIFLVGRALNRLLPGRPVGLIMEIPSYHKPSLGVVLRQAWARFRPFLLVALPLIILGSVVIEGLNLAGFLDHISRSLSPVTVLWLGLPSFTGVLLILGTLRKEAALVLLATVAGTMDIATFMSPLQMVVFSFVVMVYVPCIATIAALVKEVGWRNAILISLAEIGMAIFLGGVMYRVLGIFM
ncbi:MAG: ferrous iron transport protein B [Candidatus Thermoplasmatota archaeon]